jgi:hypothetical protein
MGDRNVCSHNAQAPETCRLEACIDACREHFNHILSNVISSQHQEAHQVEAFLFKQLMKLGFLLLTVFFVSHHDGDYGETMETDRGLATRGRPSERSYFSIFGKLKVWRYLYVVDTTSFAPLDRLLHLPARCYSYFLAERVNLLTIQDSYEEAVHLLQRLCDLTLSVSAAETISQESSAPYESYYAYQQTLPAIAKEEEYTVVSFDGKGVPMIKKEAAKIQARLGTGEKRQKKQEALVGVTYTVNAYHRTAQEVAGSWVFPEQQQAPRPSPPRAQHLRSLASVARSKRQVMAEIKRAVQAGAFDATPLICVMDGAKSLWTAFQDTFQDIKNKVMILDIIHVLEYIWLMANMKYKKEGDQSKSYVSEKLTLILQGKVASYILELQNELRTGTWKKSQKQTFNKVITYLKNHKQYMKYDVYLAKGYPIGSGVVESACSHVVKNRMEVPGARWGVSGAEAILRLRSVAKSQDWDEYWAFYTTNAQNDDYFSQTYNTLNLQQKIPA